ncbi:hypothetical protein CRG98_047063 [Punica granatum]|uniref:Uncharacterized protein n=1 Tax=Punica granatum TaxID=22663 RepID=A0A2I0HMM9_PUNGR|nr:hypothetical protein CRG98_047063 [Punica granatum]
MIPDRLSCTTQVSKADSSSSAAGDQTRNPSSPRQPTPTEERKRKGGTTNAGTTADSDSPSLGVHGHFVQNLSPSSQDRGIPSKLQSPLQQSRHPAEQRATALVARPAFSRSAHSG